MNRWAALNEWSASQVWLTSFSSTNYYYFTEDHSWTQALNEWSASQVQEFEEDPFSGKNTKSRKGFGLMDYGVPGLWPKHYSLNTMHTTALTLNTTKA
jgi:hypothetical protein